MPPKSKGDRDAMTTRPPRQVGNLIRAKAARAGVPYGDYIAAVLAQYVGLPHLMPMPEAQDFFDLLKETNVSIEETEEPRIA